MGINARKKLLVVQVAALGYDLLSKEHDQSVRWMDMDFMPIQTVMPAVTCTVQASFRTARQPNQHGMIANGLFQRDLAKAMFWEQSAHLVTGQRIWKAVRDARRKVAMLFWQQSIGEDVDIVLSPAPVHKHHGGMIQTCYSNPESLYPWLCRKLKRSFKLRHYWGPLASSKAGDWIADATCEIMLDKDLACDVCLTYLPTLDYDLQRHGPNSPKAAKALDALSKQIAKLTQAAESGQFEVVIFGDYAIAATTGPAILPNVALVQTGLLELRHVQAMAYPVMPQARAFAMCDHEIAHIYVRNESDIASTTEVLRTIDGIDAVLDRSEMALLHLDHPNSGELLAIAKPGRWFAYPWWTDPKQAPDFASHIDIHNKPGFDPCELFLGFPPTKISQNTSRVGGTHGRADAGRPVAYASTVPLGRDINNLISLSSALAEWLGE